MSDLVTDKRSRVLVGDLPSKYPTLPGISNDENSQLVPYVSTLSSRPDASSETDDRIRLLETRLHVTEKSNRAMLDEVVRLQTEVKNISRRGEEQLREERNARQYLENSLRASNDLMSQLSSRLRATEERLAEERAVVNQALSQGQSLESLMQGFQADQTQRKNLEQSKVSTLETDLEEINRARHQLERIAFQLVDEVRTIKVRVEAQQSELSGVTNDMRNKTRKLEDDYYHNVDDLRKKMERQSEPESGGTQLKSQVEQRLSELREVVMEMRNKYESEAHERRELENRVISRANELNRQIQDQNRKREESLHNIETLIKERQHATETERLSIQSKLTEATEEMTTKMMESELKAREESFKRHTELERLVRSEQDARASYERDQRQEAERRWENQRRLHDQESAALKEQHRADRKKYTESLRKMDEAVTLLEKQIQESHRDTGRVLNAEIKSRKSKDKENQARYHEIEEKISAATSALQQAIGGVAKSVSKLSQSSTKNVHSVLAEQRAEMQRYMTDMDARIVALQQRLSGVDDRVEAKVAAASTAMSANIREKMESVSMWQTATTATLNELRTQKNALQEEIYRQQERIELLKSEIQSRVSQEMDSRLRDVENLKREIEITKEMIPKEDLAKKRELEDAQASIRKLAESLQTVKTVLGMKIQSENKMRVEEVKNLQDEVIKLRAILDQILHTKHEPRLFVKPENTMDQPRMVIEHSQPIVNKWSLYTAYRWLNWKSRWMYLRWAIANREQATALSRDNTQEPRTSRKDENEEDEPKEENENDKDDDENEPKEKPPSPNHPWDEEEKQKNAAAAGGADKTDDDAAPASDGDAAKPAPASDGDTAKPAPASDGDAAKPAPAAGADQGTST